MNETDAMTVTVRRAVAEDVPLILSLIKELAAFENQPDAVRTSEADLLRHGFGAHPAFEALIAESGGNAAGMALFYTTFSTWEGRPGIFIDDLYVRETARSRGVGGALLRAVAQIVMARGYGRMELNVLDWNPARQFYEHMGLAYLGEWLPMRADGERLRRMAEA